MNRVRCARVAGVLTLVAASCVLPSALTTTARATPAATSAARTVRITIKPNGVVNGFSPSRLSIKRGTTVVVVNRDSMRHTMTSNAKGKNGNPLFSTPIAPHASATIKGIPGLAAGTYRFYCSIHPSMRGTLIVTGKPGGTTGTGTTFTQPLAVPRQITGAQVTVPVEQARVRALPTGATTPMWTFGGSYPGPTIREPAGQATDVTYDDELPASSGSLSIHLHGDHHSSADDGQPAATTGDQTNVLLQPGSSRTYHYSLADSAAPDRGGFDFYHDHTMGRTGRNNWNGLQGMFIVDSPVESELGLPHGPYDVPLLVSDRSFTSANALTPYSVAGTPPNDTTVGTHILVDGRYLPYLNVSTHRYRLRLLNASDYQSYDFALSDGRTFDQIGTGNGLLPHAVRRSDIILGPAQRADVIVDFGGELHKNVVLRSIPSTDHSPGAIGTPSAPLMQFRVASSATDRSKAPYELQAVPPLDVPATVAQTWDFGLGTDANGAAAWTVNGQPYDPSVVMHEVARGSTELWELRNDTDVTHYIHLHEEAWHTIARIDANGVSHAPPAWEEGLEDTWRLDPGTAVEVAAKFTDYPGVFMIHCHMLDHEDDGMMAQFAVVDPADPQLPSGFRYRPLSGRHRALVTAHTTTGMTMGAGMTMGTARRRTPHHTPVVVVAAPPVASAPAAWSSTLVRCARSVGIEAALVLLVLAGVRARRRRTRR